MIADLCSYCYKTCQNNCKNKIEKMKRVLPSIYGNFRYKNDPDLDRYNSLADKLIQEEIIFEFF